MISLATAGSAGQTEPPNKDGHPKPPNDAYPCLKRRRFTRETSLVSNPAAPIQEPALDKRPPVSRPRLRETYDGESRWGPSST